MNSQTNQCPICGEKGASVPHKTVTRVINQDAQKLVTDSEYFLCMNSRCDVGYFNGEKETIDKSMSKKPIWYKRGAEQRLGCYCGDITEEEIFKTVIETNLREQESITLYLRGRLYDTCESTNPLGVCCSDVFSDMINTALQMKTILKNKGDSQVDSIQIDEAKLKAGIEETKSCSCDCSCNNQEPES